MREIVTAGRLLFAVAMVAFGVEHLVWARFGQAAAAIQPLCTDVFGAIHNRCSERRAGPRSPRATEHKRLETFVWIAHW
jgi:hypothetical protein